MLEFYKDGKRVELRAIHGNGQVGQMLIYGEKVNWGPNSSSPLAQYQCPSIFKILEIGKGSIGYHGYYRLKDSNGKCFSLNLEGRDTWYLYDAQEWLTWQDLHQSEKLSRKQKKIELLESHLSLLKDILIKQGIHIVTTEQAKDLNL